MLSVKQVFSNYYRLSKPGIIYGNIITVIAGYFFAAKAFDPLVFIGVVVGVALVIAGACAINNVLDQNIDAKMSRTKKRPLVTGAISQRAAVTYSAITALVGFSVLGVTQNWLTTLLVLIAYIDYVIVYGVTKRKSPLGTHIGAISGALPLVVGYTAVIGKLDVAAILLFMLMAFWQMAHFYGIALYRKKDYARAGIPVLPVVKGEATTRLRTKGNILRFTIVAALLFIGGFIGYIGGIVLIVASLWWLFQATKFTELDGLAWGRKVFGASLSVVLIMSAALALGNWLP